MEYNIYLSSAAVRLWSLTHTHYSLAETDLQHSHSTYSKTTGTKTVPINLFIFDTEILHFVPENLIYQNKSFFLSFANCDAMKQTQHPLFNLYLCLHVGQGNWKVCSSKRLELSGVREYLKPRQVHLTLLWGIVRQMKSVLFPPHLSDVHFHLVASGFGRPGGEIMILHIKTLNMGCCHSLQCNGVLVGIRKHLITHTAQLCYPIVWELNFK